MVVVVGVAGGESHRVELGQEGGDTEADAGRAETTKLGSGSMTISLR